MGECQPATLTLFPFFRQVTAQRESDVWESKIRECLRADGHPAARRPETIVRMVTGHVPSQPARRVTTALGTHEQKTRRPQDQEGAAETIVRNSGLSGCS